MYSLCVNALFWLSIKMRPQYPLVSDRTPLPWEGRTKDVMQVLLIKHVSWICHGRCPSVRTSCIHYVLMLWSVSLLKGDLNIP